MAHNRLRPWQKPTPVTVVVPMFNETQGIPQLAQALSRLDRALEPRYAPTYLLIDDGSTDATVPTAGQCFADWPNVRILCHPENRGIARAIETGIRAAQTEFVCTLDADCTYDPLVLLPMLQLLEEGADLVTASPYHPLGKVEQVPPWRLALSRGASLLYRSVLSTRLHTFTSCCRAYRKSVVVNLLLNHGGFTGIAELLARLVLEGGTVAEQPAVLRARRFGQSKMRILRVVLGHCRLLTELLVLRAFKHLKPSAPRRVLHHAPHQDVPQRHTTKMPCNHSPMEHHDADCNP